MFMSGKRTLLVAAICCGFLLFASSCLAAESIGGAKYREEVMGFTAADEEKFTENMVSEGIRLQLPYYFKLVKPRSKAVKEVLENIYERNPKYRDKWLVCDAGVLQDEDRNTFWLNLGPRPRSQCLKDPTRMAQIVTKYLNGKIEAGRTKDFPTLGSDQVAHRRDTDGNWLVDPDEDPNGSIYYQEYRQRHIALEKEKLALKKEGKEGAGKDGDNDEL